jgi:hypothetical protein
MSILDGGRARARTFLLTVLAVLAAGCASATTAVAASPTATLGVYSGAAAPGQVAAFDRWNGGQHSAYAMDFLSMESWDQIAHPDWWASGWQGTGRRMVYSVPLLPSTGGSLAAGAAGAYDGSFRSMAATLVARGQGRAILRIGWEFNGSWFPWSASKDPAAFVAYWRRVVKAVRGVPGAGFTIDWSINLGSTAVPAEAVYPGDAYVDVVGADSYDMGWAPNYQDSMARWRNLVKQRYGLDWLRSFAAAHAKPVSLPEWGLTIRADGHGGGDNTNYIRRMHEWIRFNNVLYHCYFEFDDHAGAHRLMGGRFPLGSAEFRRFFGPAAP